MALRVVSRHLLTLSQHSLSLDGAFSKKRATWRQTTPRNDSRRHKTPSRDGTSHIALEPLELLEKLAALIPRPYVNLIVYHGVLAPNAKWRREVVDFGRSQVESASSASTPKKVVGSQNRTWAELMRRGLHIDVLECRDCGGRLRFVAAILFSSAIRQILRHLGLPSDPVALAPARAPPELDDAWAC